MQDKGICKDLSPIAISSFDYSSQTDISENDDRRLQF
ncbi:hypothetical protein T05_1764 [Trichinella murrelli]|uniref:Uncharacterized protein n=1 Tax=Trichinella murrelli TaxID=144512 RepID=A0A0V0STH2_9BILA|nr:hypothetical protein T05_1764 [Trichinella murrelli]